LLLVPVIGFGQEKEAAGQGYLYVAPGAGVSSGGSAGTLHFGGGGEFNIYKGVGVGGEIGYLSPIRSMGSGVGVFSLNGLYSFRKDGRSKVVPFVTAGYSLLFRRGHLNAFNFGGGVNYWFSKRTGLRFEFRDYVRPEYLGSHIIEGRIGVNFH
jgi:hypothetical protein